MSDSSDDVLQDTDSAISSCSDDVLSTTVSMSDRSKVVSTACSDCSADAPQATVCQTEDIVPPQSSQLQDGTIIEWWFHKPLPMEVALLILANQGPRVQEIIQLLDWRVESDHYVLVLERPVSCTREYCLPEYLLTGKYHGKPATVWSLGILLLALLCGDFPKVEDLEKINNNTWAKDGLSKECCDIICHCLQLDPKQRFHLKKLSLHDWFTA
ncbi:hypothetical protein QQF64_024442 [Cirrhinus molitorella]|uniref:non-specific serine/threonine protein kinase n=1 Tax=Cirrhinus molitorella TaxID=172907 RepID=A0ABR3NL81_9TELE